MVGYSMIEYQGKLWDICLLSVERMNSFPSPPRSTCPFWTSFNFCWVLQPSCSRRNLQLSRKVVLDCAVFDSLRSVHSLSFVWQYVRLGKAQKVGTLRLVRLSPRAPRGVLTSILQFHQLVRPLPKNTLGLLVVNFSHERGHLHVFTLCLYFTSGAGEFYSDKRRWFQWFLCTNS